MDDLECVTMLSKFNGAIKKVTKYILGVDLSVLIKLWG